MGTTSRMGDWIKPEAVLFGTTSCLALMNKKTTRITLNKITIGSELTNWCYTTSRHKCPVMNSPSPTAVNDRLTGNKRLHRCTDNHPTTLPEHNALTSTYKNVCTDKRPGLQRQRNALLVNIQNYKETKTNSVKKIYV